MTIGCTQGGNCCTACADHAPRVFLTEPLSLDGLGADSVGMGNPVMAIATIAQAVASVAAVRSSTKASGYQGETAEQIAQQIVAQKHAQNSLTGVLSSPPALIGLGAVTLALVLKSMKK